MGKPQPDNPYPNCHWVLFNISDEYWDIIAEEYMKFNSNPSKYEFPKKPFGKSVISKEHEKAMSKTFGELFERINKGEFNEK